MQTAQILESRCEESSIREVGLSTINYQLSTINSSRGFTLIETFVAITILITAVAGPLTIASKGLQSAVLAKDQLTASFLAQEGIEFIRERRDTNCLQLHCTDLSTGDAVANIWLTSHSSFNSTADQGLNTCRTDLNGNMSCQVDAVNDIITACGASGCDPLYYDDSIGGPTSGFYTYDTSKTRTSFVRSIQITPITSVEAMVVSTVTWKTGPFTRQIVVSEIIYDWQ